MPVPLILGAVGLAAAGLGYFAKQSGSAIDSSGNTALKMAAAGLVTFVLLKKAKVI